MKKKLWTFTTTRIQTFYVLKGTHRASESEREGENKPLNVISCLGFNNKFADQPKINDMNSCVWTFGFYVTIALALALALYTTLLKYSSNNRSTQESVCVSIEYECETIPTILFGSTADTNLSVPRSVYMHVQCSCQQAQHFRIHIFSFLDKVFWNLNYSGQHKV